MADPKDELAKKIGAVKAQISKEQAAGKDPKKDATCRQLRKTLKRAQRRLALLAKPTVEQRQARVSALTEMVNKRMGEINQGGSKQSQGNPYVHSLRKKLKSLNKRKKHLDRVVKKIQAKQPPAAAAAPAAAPTAEKK